MSYLQNWHSTQTRASHIPDDAARPKVESLLIFHDVVKAANMRQDLHYELVAAVEREPRLTGPADSGRCSGDTEEVSLYTHAMGL